VLGGVLAIGAAIYTWVTNAKGTNEELEKMSKWSIAEAKRLREINASHKEETSRIKEQTEVLRTQREIGKNEGDDLKRKLDLENQIQDIQEKGRKEGVTEENINAQIKAAKELAALEQRTAEVIREKARIAGVIAEANAKAADDARAKEIREETEALSRKLNGETELQRARQLLVDAAKLERQQYFASGAERAKIEQDVIKLRLQSKEIVDRENKRQAEESKKLNNEIIQGVSDSVKDTAKMIAEIIKTAGKEAISLAKEAARIAEENENKAKEKMDKRIEDEMRSPEQKRSDKQAEKDREKAIRQINNRDRTRAQNRARGAYGQRDIFAHQPSKSAQAAESALMARTLREIAATNLVVGVLKHR